MSIDEFKKQVTGVYLLSLNNEVVYVGQSFNVYARLGVHLSEDRKEFDSIDIIPCECSQLSNIEKLHIETHQPIYNLTHNPLYVKEKLLRSTAIKAQRNAQNALEKANRKRQEIEDRINKKAYQYDSIPNAKDSIKTPVSPTSKSVFENKSYLISGGKLYFRIRANYVSDDISGKLIFEGIEYKYDNSLLIGKLVEVKNKRVTK